jgi:peptidyl-prolyl cis-trans isomerase D
MLERIRKLARSPIAVALIIVPIIAAFALFGISDIFRGTGDAVALVGEERVTVSELNRAYERELQTIQRENPRFTREQADEIGLGEQVLQGLVARAAVDAKARQLGLAVSDVELRDTIQSLPVFRNAFSDQFDRQTYESVLAQNQMTPTMFERDVRGDIRRSQYLTSVLAGLDAPDVLARARHAYAEERRDIAALLIAPSLADEVGEPSDDDLAAFIEENADAFRRPEQRRFTLVRANPDLFARDVDVAEADIRELYEIRLENGELSDPATRSFVQ